MAHFDTALNIVNNAGKELGLFKTTVSNPWTSTEDNVVQLCALLNRVGRSLVRARTWTHLTEEYTFNTVASTDSYALPAGFDRFLTATGWNRTTTYPLGGPFSPAQWQMVKATTALGTIIRPFRIRENLLYLYPAPTAAEAIYFEYISRYWVVTSGSSPNADSVTATTDVCWFDEPLMVSGLKLAFRRAKGMDTTSAQAEFDEVYAACAGGDGVAPIIRIAGDNGPKLIDESNVPDTGYGS